MGLGKETLTQLFAYKISALSGQEYIESPVYDKAYLECLKMVGR
jgi:hypothetical protein